MAIRQVDERFLVGTIIPALLRAEELADALDDLDHIRQRTKGVEYVESAAAKTFTTALDDLCLRIKYEGTLGAWKSIEERLPSIRRRCPHPERNKRVYSIKTEEGKSIASRPTASCVRCHQALEDILPPPVEDEQVAS